MIRESSWKKGIVIGIVFVFIGTSNAFGINTAVPTSSLSGIVSYGVPTDLEDNGGYPGSVGNVKVSPGERNDSNPRMTTNVAGDIIIVYEHEEIVDHIPMKTVPVVYSADEGSTWVQKFVFNSLKFQGSGFLSDPDIIYNHAQDLLWCVAVDQLTEMYNNEMYFIPGDIANATDFDVIDYAISGSTSDYYETACAHTNDYYLSFTSECNYGPGYERLLAITWVMYPDFEYPPALGGFYVDGQSLIRTAPIYEIEADYNVNRWFLVAESEAIAGGTQICIKSGTTDKTLIDSGEQQNSMDKYGDPEQAPGEFLGVGTDPDVSGSGSKLAVVFVRDGDILCSVSSCVATYEPEFHWTTTTVDTGGASTPAVHMYGNTICVAYVKNGNLYYRVSEDKGATWGDVQQKNDVNGTVVAEKGSVDVCKLGIAFVDNRNGNNDVYFTTTKIPVPELKITGLTPNTMIVKNIGDAPAYNVSWSITVTPKEGFIFPGRAPSGTVIGSLVSGDEITVGQRQILFGFGSIEIIGTAWADDAPLVSEKLSGRLLLFFFFV